MTREDNMQIISNLLSSEAVRRIVEKNYSDDVIEYISGYAPTAETFSNTKYKVETVEKLMGLMKEGLIDSYDMIELMEDSVSHSKNEQYIGRFVNKPKLSIIVWKVFFHKGVLVCIKKLWHLLCALLRLQPA